MKLKLIIFLAQSTKITNITYKIKTMAFKMKGMAPMEEPIGAGINQRTNLGRGLGTIFGSKEKRDRNKAYFKKKREVRKALKEDGTYGDTNNETGMELTGRGVNSGQFTNFGKSTARTRGKAAKEVALSHFGDEQYFDRNNYSGAATTKKVKKKDINANANAYASANTNKLLSVDADIDVNKTKYIKDDAKVYKTNITPESIQVIPGVTTPGATRTETFDNVPDAEKRNQELLSTPGVLKIKKAEEKGVDMKSGLGFNMKSNIYELSGAKARIMQSSNPNPITTSSEEHEFDFGGGSTETSSQEAYKKPGSSGGPKAHEIGGEVYEKYKREKSRCEKNPNAEGCTGFNKPGKDLPGMNTSNTNITLSYQEPSTTTPDQTIVTPEKKETTGTSIGGQTGKKIGVDVDADIKGKLPKIKLPKIKLPEIITDANNDGTAIGRGIRKFKKKRKEKKIAKNVARGNCPPCPPCD
jgi:hypothetical protein